jgi:hypothetical protein
MGEAFYTAAAFKVSDGVSEKASFPVVPATKDRKTKEEQASEEQKVPSTEAPSACESNFEAILIAELYNTSDPSVFNKEKSSVFTFDTIPISEKKFKSIFYNNESGYFNINERYFKDNTITFNKQVFNNKDHRFPFHLSEYMMLCASKTMEKQKKNIDHESLIDFHDECNRYVSLYNINGATNFMTWGDVLSFMQEQVPLEMPPDESVEEEWQGDAKEFGERDVVGRKIHTLALQNLTSGLRLASSSVKIEKDTAHPRREDQEEEQQLLTTSRVMINANMHSTVLNTDVTLRFVYDIISEVHPLFKSSN